MEYMDLVTIVVTFHDAVAISWTGGFIEDSSNSIDKKIDMMRVRIAAFRASNRSIRKPMVAQKAVGKCHD